MAQFDVYRSSNGGLLLDCQSEVLAYLATRMAVPLLPVADAPELRLRLNPVFEIEGERYAMITQFAAAVRVSELRKLVITLRDYRFDIIGAFDMALTGV
ncbi:CcdB family protein [Sphingomonas sp. NPDC079357]|jgi:toxin CcdB|uniref:CcdB family protein n=1 Tax=Sphingomonas sp. NPDC079357 TaxID=3364518 RepID=UPI00384A8508